jgi:hypothetical protein
MRRHISGEVSPGSHQSQDQAIASANAAQAAAEADINPRRMMHEYTSRTTTYWDRLGLLSGRPAPRQPRRSADRLCFHKLGGTLTGTYQIVYLREIRIATIRQSMN